MYAGSITDSRWARTPPARAYAGHVDEDAMDIDAPLTGEEIADVVTQMASRRQAPAIAETGMDVDTPSYSGDTTLLVLDTNVLVSMLSLLDALLRYSHVVSLLLPRRTLRELDGLKMSTRATESPVDLNRVDSMHARRQRVQVGHLARRSTKWLERAFREGRVYGQKLHEVGPMASSQSNDEQILDAALYWSSRGTRTILLSLDTNLRVTALSQNVECYAPMPGSTPEQLLRDISLPPALLQAETNGVETMSVGSHEDAMEVMDTAPRSNGHPQPQTRSQLFDVIRSTASDCLAHQLMVMLHSINQPIESVLVDPHCSPAQAVALIFDKWDLIAAQIKPAEGMAASSWSTPGRRTNRLSDLRSNLDALQNMLDPGQKAHDWSKTRFEGVLSTLSEAVSTFCAGDDIALKRIAALYSDLAAVFSM